MSGKKTYLYPSPGGHQDLEVSLVGPLPRGINWLIMERALGRSPSDLERCRIADVVESQAEVIQNNRVVSGTSPDNRIDSTELIRGSATCRVARRQRTKVELHFKFPPHILAAPVETIRNPERPNSSHFKRRRCL